MAIRPGFQEEFNVRKPDQPNKGGRLGKVDRRALILALIVPLAMLAAVSGHAEAQTAPEIKARLTADRKELTVGDRASLTLEVTYPAGHQVILPRLPANWEAFEVRDQSPSETTANDDGTETITKVFEIALFAPGTFVTPDLEISVRDPAGQIDSVFASRIWFSVVPVLTEDDTELRDIKPQRDLQVTPLWPLAAGGLLLAGVIAVAIYLLLGRRRLSQPVASSVIDTRTAYEIVRDELEEIERLDLPGQNHFKEHYAMVADAIRRYLEGEHGLPALDRTTEEVHSALAGADITKDGSQEVVRFLSDCDLVKFTELHPEVGEARRSTAEARGVIEHLRPQRPREAVADEAAGVQTA